MEEIMKQLAESLRKAKESGKFTAEHVIVQETMTEACKSVKGNEERLRKITGGSIIASVEELENQGNATEEMITAAVEGAVDSVKAAFQEAVEGMEAELEQIELRLREEEEKKAAGLRAVLEGAGENAGAFMTNVAVMERRYIGYGGSGRNTAIARSNQRSKENLPLKGLNVGGDDNVKVLGVCDCFKLRRKETDISPFLPA